MTGELARLLARSDVGHVSVSIDGASAATHDSIRGVKGAHRRALAGVQNLVKAGFAPQLIMTLMRENVSELEPLLRLARRVGAGSVKFNIVQPSLRGEEMHASGRALSVREILRINHRVERELRPRYPFKIFMDIPMAFRSIRTILDGDGCSVCGIKTIIGLIADGSYALCGIGENVPGLVFGRAGEGELKAIWRGHPVLRKLRAGLPDKLKGICGRCLLKSACLGSCVAQNYHDSGDLLGAFWVCRHAEAADLFPKTRLRP
jgi:SynChlorMet cassette radical SAM/SPASM protein ScmF